MSDRPANGPGNAEPALADIDAATRRLMTALDALESAVERRRDADRDENELETRIQARGSVAAGRRARRIAGEIAQAGARQSRDRRTAGRGDRHHPLGARCRRGLMSHINVTINGRQYRM